MLIYELCYDYIFLLPCTPKKCLKMIPLPPPLSKKKQNQISENYLVKLQKKRFPPPPQFYEFEFSCLFVDPF